ncbi:hypothetical protein [Sphingobacterium kitahiroshimense]|uniref:hypothetical protein n=1 Tax=Sphingobacterium kitahiroshimense TaxID=470446 RepID=UPI003207E737
MKNNKINYFHLALFLAIFLSNLTRIAASEKVQISSNVKIDSILFFIDGEKKIANQEVVESVKNENIHRSFLLFGENVQKALGSNQVMIIITDKNKDSAKVKNLLAIINKNNLIRSKPIENEIINKQTIDEPNKGFSKMYVLDLKTAGINEMEQLTKELQKNNIYTSPIKYSFLEGKLNSLAFSWNYNKINKEIKCNDINDHKNYLLILTNENGVIEIKKVIK